MSSQQALHDGFIQSGLSILDHCSPTPVEEAEINRKIEEVNKAWDKLHHRLYEREAALKDIQALTTVFYDDFQSLTKWLAETSDTLDGMSPVGHQPELIAEQKEQAQVGVTKIRINANFKRTVTRKTIKHTQIVSKDRNTGYT